MTLEKNLKERIKELTCLYEVSSIIVNNDYNELDKTLYSIALSLRKSLQLVIFKLWYHFPKERVTPQLHNCIVI